MIPDDLDSLNRWCLVYSAHAVAKPTSLSLLVEIWPSFYHISTCSYSYFSCLVYIETNPPTGNSTHTRQAPFLFSHQDTSDRPIPITNTNHHFRRHQQPPHIMIPQFRHCGRLINCLSHRYCLVVAQSVHCLWYTPALPLTRWAVVYVSIIHLSLFVIRGNT